MSVSAEATWRTALERKGKDWVTRELALRRGQPGDDVLEVVYEKPYPTREFCQKWCAEQDRGMFSMSPVLVCIVMGVIGVLLFSTMGVSSLVRHIKDAPLRSHTVAPL